MTLFCAAVTLAVGDPVLALGPPPCPAPPPDAAAPPPPGPEAPSSLSDVSDVVEACDVSMDACGDDDSVLLPRVSVEAEAVDGAAVEEGVPFSSNEDDVDDAPEAKDELRRKEIDVRWVD